MNNQRIFLLPFSKDELLEAVDASLERIRPILIADGGDISLIDIEDNKVYVKLEGACKKCSISSVTLKNSVERQLKVDISPDIVIVNIENEIKRDAHAQK